MNRKLRFLPVLLVVVICSLLSFAQSNEVYFSLSSDRTFRPDQKPKVNVYAHNVDVLEFRVYKVQDPEAFFAKLDDLHEFGVKHYSPREQVDQRTWLEKFHDWKIRCWRRIRNFFRGQFSDQSRAEIRDWHSGKAKRSRLSGAVGFAGIPILNSQQLVARWRMELPPKYVSESSDLPLENLKAGLYAVEATDGTYRAYTVIVVSEMAIITKTAPGQIVAFTVDRKTGEPVSGAKISVWSKKNKVVDFTTGADGMGESAVSAKSEETPSGDGENGYSANWILAQRGDDVAIVAPYSLSLSSNPQADWAGYVYTDRPVYRPGHTVQFKAIVRKRSGEKLLLPAERQAEVTISDAANNPVLKKSYTLSPFGSVNGSLELPPTAPLGYYTISVAIAGSRIAGSFEVQEYKKPEYFVKVTPERSRVLQGEGAKATIEARYYFGEPVANAKVTYVVHTQRAWNSDEDFEAGEEGVDSDQYFFGEQILQQEGKLDANGRLAVTIPTKVQNKEKIDVNYRIEARVTDAANREVAGHNALLATYGTFRLTASTSSYIYRVGDSIPVVVQAIDYDKHPVQTDFKVELLRHKRGREDTAIYTGSAKTGPDGYARFNVAASDSSDGTVLRVSAMTPERREVEARNWLWIVGKNESTWGEEGNEQQLQVIADKSSYKVGDVAHLVVMGGTEHATLFVTTEGRTVTSHRLIQANGVNPTIDVPITEHDQPNFFVNAFMVNDDKFYSGSKNVKVPPVERTLSIEISPSKQQFQPGENAAYNLLVKDAAGAPVKAELSFGVVDDAIYAVRPESSGNIVSAFYENRYGGVQTEQSFSFYFHGEAGKRSFPIAGMRGAPRDGGAHRALAQVKATEFVQPKVRKAFPDTTFWSPEIHTDESGHATVHLNFPDSLTTWRTTVRAITADTKAGAATNKILVRKNLLVRLAVPRFFRQGDEVTVSTIVHNYLESTKTVRMSLDVTGLDIVSGATQQVSVPQRGEAKLDWRLRTKPGQTSATLLAKALTNEELDAMEISLPVVPFGVKQGLASGGTITELTGHFTSALNFPAGVDASARGIDVELSPSIAGAIFDGLEYLTSFPYGCTEQTMSSFLPNVVVANTLRELKVPAHIDPALLKRQVDAGLDRLYDFQHQDGGWGWWKDDDSMVFMTAYVISGMAQAQATGYEVKPAAFQNGKSYLKKMLAEHPKMIPDLRAFVVYSLALAGERDRNSLNKVWGSHLELSSEGLALAGLAMRLNGDARANEAVQVLHNTAKQEGDGIYWPSTKDDLLEIDVDNSAEATAYAVKLLAQFSPDDPELPKAVLWIMRHRDEGYWESTKQTAMVLVGITEYLKVSKELDPSFNADVYVNGKQVLSRRFTAEDATSGISATVHLPYSAVEDVNNVEVRKSGAGRLYWLARGSYYSTDRSLYNKNGLKLSIAREYFTMTSGKAGEKIVYDLSHLSGPVHTGDLLAVKVTVTGDKWKYLMIEDPIPAGTEFIERDELYELRQKPEWWRNWYSRREFHDDRAVMFQTWFTNNVREYFYLVKVTNAGNFRISPASVQPMYQPNVLSTTAPATMEVK
jgi:alpha-2-macroglobulin